MNASASSVTSKTSKTSTAIAVVPPAAKHDTGPLLRISAKFLQGLRAIADEDNPLRAFVNYAYAEPHPDGGVTLMASDGSAGIVMHDKDGYAREPIAFKPNTFKLPKHVMEDGTFTIVQVDKAELACSGVTESFPCETLWHVKGAGSVPNDGKIDWPRDSLLAILQRAASAPIETTRDRFFDTYLLDGFGAAGQPFVSEGYAGVNLRIIDGGTALVTFGPSIPAIGLLMAQVGDWRADDRQAWTKALLEPAKATDKPKARKHAKAKPAKLAKAA